jgi:hypothetical protein
MAGDPLAERLRHEEEPQRGSATSEVFFAPR